MQTTELLFSPRRRRALLATAGAVLSLATSAQPVKPLSERPIRIIVGAPAGGSSDFVARLIGDAMGKSLGQPIVVDNKPGALGAIAIEALLAAPRDGYTYLVAVNGLFSETPHTVKPRYDPLNDVKPLAELGNGGLVMVGNAALPPKNLVETVAYVKANPGKINFASYSPGTLSHVMGLLLNKSAGLDMQHVGYKGSPPALQDLMAGQVQFMFDGQATALPYIKAGKLRAFAVSSAERSQALPDVPTLAELGYKDMTRNGWQGLWTLPDAPAAAQQRMRDEALKALAQPAIRDRLASLGMAVNTSKPPTPEEMSRTLAADSKAVGETLKSVNYKPE